MRSVREVLRHVDGDGQPAVNGSFLPPLAGPHSFPALDRDRGVSALHKGEKAVVKW